MASNTKIWNPVVHTKEENRKYLENLLKSYPKENIHVIWDIFKERGLI